MSYEEPVYGDGVYEPAQPSRDVPPSRQPNTFERLPAPNRPALLLGGGILLLALVVLGIVLLTHDSTLYAAMIHGRVGYINSSGKVRIQPQFADAGRFEEGLAPVLVGQRWGYINHDNKVEIAPQFD